MVARQENPDRSRVIDETPDEFQEIETHHDRPVTVSNEYSAPPFPLLYGNLRAVQTIANHTTSVDSRHLELRYFRTREYIELLKLTVSHISTKLNVANVFTELNAADLWSI